MEPFIRRFEKNPSEAARVVCPTRPTMSDHSFSGLDRVIYEINQLTNSRTTCAALSREVFRTHLINVSIETNARARARRKINRVPLIY